MPQVLARATAIWLDEIQDELSLPLGIDLWMQILYFDAATGSCSIYGRSRFRRLLSLLENLVVVQVFHVLSRQILGIQQVVQILERVWIFELELVD